MYSVVRSYPEKRDFKVDDRVVNLTISTDKKLPEKFFEDFRDLLAKHANKSDIKT